MHAVVSPPFGKIELHIFYMQSVARHFKKDRRNAMLNMSYLDHFETYFIFDAFEYI